MHPYVRFLLDTQVCENCGWTGAGADMTMGEPTLAGENRYCPSCGVRHAHLMLPALSASKDPLPSDAS